MQNMFQATTEFVDKRLIHRDLDKSKSEHDWSGASNQQHIGFDPEMDELELEGLIEQVHEVKNAFYWQLGNLARLHAGSRLTVSGKLPRLLLNKHIPA